MCPFSWRIDFCSLECVLHPKAGPFAKLAIAAHMRGQDLIGRDVFPFELAAKIGSQLQLSPTRESAVALGM